MANTAQLKKTYVEQIAPALEKQFNYSSKMQVPVLKKIVINQGLRSEGCRYLFKEGYRQLQAP